MTNIYGNITTPWLIKDNEKAKYEGIFESLGPVGGKLPGDKVRPVLLNSKLPMEVLGKVWELSDIDKDGCLDKEEFCVAMYLVYRAIEKEAVPSVLPANLIPPSKRHQAAAPTSSSLDRILPGAVSVLPPMPSKAANSSHQSRHSSTSSNHLVASPKHTGIQSQWIASPADKNRFVGIFQQNKDPTDNLINGVTARNVFVQSGLAQNILAHVWNMCDQQQCGKLNQDQFVMAMHLISQKVKGIELPPQVTAEMISASGHDSGFGDSGSLSDTSSGVGDSAAMRELDALNQEIEELRREKDSLTGEIQQKELAIKTTSLEVQELQDTLDRDSSSLAQLECDKAEARTRLDELEQQKSKLDAMLTDVRDKVQEENENIKSLRAQISAQEASVGQQEAELRRVRNQLSDIQKEQTQLEQRIEVGRQQQSHVEKSVKEAQSEIVKVQTQLQTVQNQRKSVSSNIEQYGKAAAAIKSESQDEPEHQPQSAFSGADMGVSDSVFSMGALQEKVEDITNDLSEDPFTTDPFKNSDLFEKSDPFSESGPYTSNTPASNTYDPFGGADPFAASSADQSDPFKASDSTFGFGKDDFGSAPHPSGDPFSGQDPFASSNADTSKSSSAFTNDPFASDPFSSTKNTFETSESSGKSSDAVFATAFATSFENQDMSKDDTKAFGAFPSSQEQAPTSSDDPWGTAFGGSGVVADKAVDPFGGDAFGSDAFGKSAFESDHPLEPASMQEKKKASAQKQNKNILTEAQQVAWAKEESKRAEEERMKKERQEQADLELAIALSKQQ